MQKSLCPRGPPTKQASRPSGWAFCTGSLIMVAIPPARGLSWVLRGWLNSSTRVRNPCLVPRVGLRIIVLKVLPIMLFFCALNYKWLCFNPTLLCSIMLAAFCLLEGQVYPSPAASWRDQTAVVPTAWIISTKNCLHPCSRLRCAEWPQDHLDRQHPPFL